MDSPERGFSFMADGPLDMRMAPELQPMDAAAIVNSWPEAELARIIRDYGEDRAANSIAARCVAPPPFYLFVTSSRTDENTSLLLA